MKTTSLSQLIKNLSASPRVRCVFTAGTTATILSPSSDIDLIVILDRNIEDVKSVYTMVENRFADIFFFDIDFVQALLGKKELSANEFEGMFADWLMKGKIEYDPESMLTNLKQQIEKEPPIQKISDSEKRDLWIKTNYNFIANSRYYSSNDPLYHEALELRLLYSVIELVTAYFSFRDISWRGEKAAIKYFKQNDPEFLSLFQHYSVSKNFDEKMKHYRQLFEKIFYGEYQKWQDDFVVLFSWKEGYTPELAGWWKDIADFIHTCENKK